MHIYFRAISFVFVLQRRTKYESVPIEYFPPSLLEVTRQDILTSLALPDSLDPHIYMAVKTIICDFHENKIKNLTARHYLINLAMTKENVERNVILAIESLFPVLKDLDIGPLRESELAASYTHPVIQALLSYDTDGKVARCANCIPDNGMDENRRPDYEVMVYEQYLPSYRTCFGELKGEGSSDTLSVMDFYRLGIFAKLEMVSSNLTGVLCFQARELTTITLPENRNETISVLSILDDLYKIAMYHSTLVRSQTPNTKHPTLPFEFVQGSKRTLPAKRKPSLGLISIK
ncbi:hypothetical protein BDB00DRAFT_920823 [Zychaea mexicana]|uniref:uncharacterized protein n=1 Tax=Zychaea mexicana TaxID=64656 RepID=UPI0022FE139C|nr:uncharacterized protein BDB00DRAFT_920823 [Zychaea mexicana]KAI9497435.1 hypothetical protein BDB00DRAFT_920823 [Zychaea mexicana]